jgi:hypothetical protein
MSAAMTLKGWFWGAVWGTDTINGLWISESAGLYAGAPVS